MKNFLSTHWLLCWCALALVLVIVLLFVPFPCPNRCAPGEELSPIADTNIVPCRDVCFYPAVFGMALFSFIFGGLFH